jgi:hypothetical protein
MAGADEVLAERTRREAARLRAEDAAAEAAESERVRNDSFRRIEVAAKYQSAFASFGEQVPQASADERPGQYRARLYETLRRRLPSSNEWADVRADSVPASARDQIESMVINAAKAEGERPSVVNLPPDRMVQRNRVDENSGAKTVEWFGRESFIKGLSQPGRKVTRFLDPRSRSVLWGPPLPRYE